MDKTDCFYYDDGCCLLRDINDWHIGRDCIGIKDCETYKKNE